MTARVPSSTAGHRPPGRALRAGCLLAALLALGHAGYSLLLPLLTGEPRPARDTWLGVAALCLAGHFLVQRRLSKPGRGGQIAALLLPLLAVAAAARGLMLL